MVRVAASLTLLVLGIPGSQITTRFRGPVNVAARNQPGCPCPQKQSEPAKETLGATWIARQPVFRGKAGFCGKIAKTPRLAAAEGTTVQPALKYDASVLIDSAALPWEPFSPAGYAEGIRMRVLRRLDDGTLRSAILDVPAGWSSAAALAGRVAEQGYVLSGELQVGGQRLEAGSFYFHPAGAASGPVSSNAGAHIIAIFEGAQSYGPASNAPAAAAGKVIEHLVAEEVPAFEPVIGGKRIGVRRRVLWEDPETGADTRHLTLPAGLSGLGAEWHPVNEEIFCLSRDPGPVNEGDLRSGWYLFNPAFAVHGGHRREQPCDMTLLEWHDGKWALNRI